MKQLPFSNFQLLRKYEVRFAPHDGTTSRRHEGSVELFTNVVPPCRRAGRATRQRGRCPIGNWDVEVGSCCNRSVRAPACLCRAREQPDRQAVSVEQAAAEARRREQCRVRQARGSGHRGATIGALDRKRHRAVLQDRQAQPDYVEADWYQGTGYYTLDDHAQCRTAFRKVVSLAPKNGAAHAFLGLCEFAFEGLRSVAATPPAVPDARRR